MRYVPPFGSADPNASFVNGDPTIGRQGSIPPAAVFENPQREILAVIEKSVITPSDADLMQLARGVRSMRMNYVDDEGTINNLLVALDPPLTSYTRGLLLHVRIRFTNNSTVRIQAGAGTVPVRKMNGQDLAEGELPAGALATLVFDGTVFQVTNFLGAGAGGGGPGGPVYNVRIPYTVDTSPTRDTIIANFTPALDPLVAGDMIAVKIANTNVGPTRLIIDGNQTVVLRPNGGAGRDTLQGDIYRDDIVIFFYDGTHFWFTPNPEINAFVRYICGPNAGADFPSVDTAMEALKRKTIGASGWVTLRMQPGIYYGAIIINHPSGNRLRVEGTMNAGMQAPRWQDFVQSGNQASDNAVNLAVCRARFGTEIRLEWGNPARWVGITNYGPGMVQFADLLIVGDQAAGYGSGLEWRTQGAVPNIGGMVCVNVCVWGAQSGWNSSSGGAGVSAYNCHALNCSYYGFFSGSGAMYALMSYTISAGNPADPWFRPAPEVAFPATQHTGCSSIWSAIGLFISNAVGSTIDLRIFRSMAYGLLIQNSSTCENAFPAIMNNAIDIFAQTASSVAVWWGPQGVGNGVGTVSPAWNTVGNYNSIISLQTNISRPSWYGP